MHDVQELSRLVLQTIEDVRQEAYFQDEVMEPIMLSLDISEQEAIQALEFCLQQGWLLNHAPGDEFFLRPGYVEAFPLRLSEAGRQVIEKSRVLEESVYG